MYLLFATPGTITGGPDARASSVLVWSTDYGGADLSTHFDMAPINRECSQYYDRCRLLAESARFVPCCHDSNLTRRDCFTAETPLTGIPRAREKKASPVSENLSFACLLKSQATVDQFDECRPECC
jgi:hypothetical protein